MVHYNRILNIDGSSIMGYLKIPCISINLPIYHGTSGTVLEHGIGHLAASSFPIGGKDTHAVLTGHTGLSSAKIFTDLTEMKREISFIHVLDKACLPCGSDHSRGTTRYKRNFRSWKEKIM